MSLTAYKPPALELVTPERPATSFAYRPISLGDEGDRQYLATITSISRYSARDNWANYERIGEVHYGVTRSAKIAGYAKFFPERINAVGQVVDIQERGVLAELINTIYGKFGGTRGLIERYYTLMKVPAEGFLIRVVENGQADGYWVISPDEIDGATLPGGKIDTTKPLRWITASVTGSDGEKNQFMREIAPEDFLGRVWNPSKRWVDMVDSPMTALAGECQQLITLTDSVMGRLRSRFALAGVLLVPSEINDANIAGPRPGEEHQDKVLNYLITVMTRNVMNHDQAVAHIPALLKGPAAALEAFRHVVLESAIEETDLMLRGELINRILDGLDVQKSQTTGNTDSNHWNSWSNAEDERRVAIAPDLEAFAHALTRAILVPELVKKGWTPGMIRGWRIGVDLSDASVKTNQAEDFRLAHDRGWINEAAGRRSVGANETDKMTPDEYVRWVGVKTQDGYLATFNLPGVKIDLDKLKSAKPPGPPGGAAAGKAGPGVGSPGSPSSNDSDTPRSRRPA